MLNVVDDSSHDHRTALRGRSKTPAQCEATGMTQDCYYCQICGKYFADENAQTELNKDDLILPGLGHKAGQPDRENERPASCSSPGGCRLVYRCKRCGRILDVKYETYPVDPDAHEWGEWTVTKAAGLAITVILRRKNGK